MNEKRRRASRFSNSSALEPRDSEQRRRPSRFSNSSALEPRDSDLIPKGYMQPGQQTFGSGGIRSALHPPDFAQHESIRTDSAMHGFVKWLKGEYGFIGGEPGKKDYFFSKKNAPPGLEIGTPVRFNPSGPSDKPVALNVSIIGLQGALPESSSASQRQDPIQQQPPATGLVQGFSTLDSARMEEWWDIVLQLNSLCSEAPLGASVMDVAKATQLSASAVLSLLHMTGIDQSPLMPISHDSIQAMIQTVIKYQDLVRLQEAQGQVRSAPAAAIPPNFTAREVCSPEIGNLMQQPIAFPEKAQQGAVTADPEPDVETATMFANPKSQLCDSVSKGSTCALEEYCIYSHSTREVQALFPGFSSEAVFARCQAFMKKTKICPNFLHGFCQTGDLCRYSHKESDIQTMYPNLTLEKIQKRYQAALERRVIERKIVDSTGDHSMGARLQRQQAVFRDVNLDSNHKADMYDPLREEVPLLGQSMQEKSSRSTRREGRRASRFRGLFSQLEAQPPHSQVASVENDSSEDMDLDPPTVLPPKELQSIALLGNPSPLKLCTAFPLTNTGEEEEVASEHFEEANTDTYGILNENGYFTCTLCNVVCGKSPVNLEHHYSGRVHHAKLELLQSGKIIHSATAPQSSQAERVERRSQSVLMNLKELLSSHHGFMRLDLLKKRYFKEFGEELELGSLSLKEYITHNFPSVFRVKLLKGFNNVHAVEFQPKWDSSAEAPRNTRAQAHIPQSLSVHSLLDAESSEAGPLEMKHIKSFRLLGLPLVLLQRVHSMGFDRPTLVQEVALPLILADPPQNLVLEAAQGSGKTVAFIIGMLRFVNVSKPGPHAVCCTSSTRTEHIINEFAQIALDVQGIQIQPILPGVELKSSKQFAAHVIVGTPSKILGLVRKGLISTLNVKVFVVDLVDQMVDKGRAKTVTLFRAMPPACHAIMTCLSFPEDMFRFSKAIAEDALLVRLSSEQVRDESSTSELTLQGIVVYVKDDYGFIGVGGGQKDYFFHRSSAPPELEVGTVVSFTQTGQIDKPVAENIAILGRAEGEDGYQIGQEGREQGWVVYLTEDYGFIGGTQWQRDLFFSRADAPLDLEEGMQVEFVGSEGKRGPVAKDIAIVPGWAIRKEELWDVQAPRERGWVIHLRNDYGFIGESDGEKDIFFNASYAPPGLKEGMEVEFVRTTGSKGPSARGLRIITPEKHHKKKPFAEVTEERQLGVIESIKTGYGFIRFKTSEGKKGILPFVLSDELKSVEVGMEVEFSRGPVRGGTGAVNLKINSVQYIRDKLSQPLATSRAKRRKA